MPRKKSPAQDLEVAVMVSHPGLTRQQLSAVKKAFKNILIATLTGTETGPAKQAPSRPKQALVKQRKVVKQEKVIKQYPGGRPKAAAKRAGSRPTRKVAKAT